MMSETAAREEVYNIRLSDLLKEYGIVTRPERIKYVQSKRKLPDIIATDILGIKTYIEGRVLLGAGTRSSLGKDSENRIRQGVCLVCVAILYPIQIRDCESDDDIIRFFKTTQDMEARIFTEDRTARTDWNKCDLNELARILRKTGKTIISDDVIKDCKKELQSAIRSCEDAFVLNNNIYLKLSNILGINQGS